MTEYPVLLFAKRHRPKRKIKFVNSRLLQEFDGSCRDVVRDEIVGIVH